MRHIPVFRPDVQCTNGIIHVIDHPFLTDNDIYVTGSAPQQKLHGIVATLFAIAVAGVRMMN